MPEVNGTRERKATCNWTLAQGSLKYSSFFFGQEGKFSCQDVPPVSCREEGRWSRVQHPRSCPDPELETRDGL